MVDMHKILNFLIELENNNNREWFHEHKKERQEATKEFENLIQELIFEIGKFDDSVLLNNPKDLTFKLVRDTRSSHDRSPYNPCFRAHISSRGKLPIPVGCFISIQPHDATMLGGGLFADMFKDVTEMVRDYIVEHGNELESIVQDNSFTKHFKLLGNQLKNVPKGYDVDHSQSDYLKYKSWFVETFIDDKVFLDEKEFMKISIQKFKAMKSFNDYFNKFFIDFQMPER